MVSQMSHITFLALRLLVGLIFLVASSGFLSTSERGSCTSAAAFRAVASSSWIRTSKRRQCDVSRAPSANTGTLTSCLLKAERERSMELHSSGEGEVEGGKEEKIDLMIENNSLVQQDQLGDVATFIKSLQSQLDELGIEMRTTNLALAQGNIADHEKEELKTYRNSLMKKMLLLMDEKKLLMDEKKLLMDEKKLLMDEKKKREAEEKCKYLQQHKIYTKNDDTKSTSLANVQDVNSLPRSVATLQDFANYMTHGNQILVDKSHFLHLLLREPRVVLLRPRRFGKSLTLSMIKYFFYGATDLFRDTALFQKSIALNRFVWSPNDPKSHNFPPCPVLHLDFSCIISGKPDAASFQRGLIRQLVDIAASEGAGEVTGDTAGEVLSSLITKLASQRLNDWKKVVILIDEYDSPLNQLASSSSKVDFAAMTEIYKNFFSVIKSMDELIEFAYVTGITSYGLVGLYSGANNFVDRTFDLRYKSLFGFTKQEVVRVITDVRKMPPDEATLKVLEAKYNGYSWLVTDEGESCEKVYNPYLIGQYCNTGMLDSFWTQTSSESLLKTFPIVSTVSFPLVMSKSSLTLPRSPMDLTNQVSNEAVGRLLLELGYATIKSVSGTRLLLDYPNDEIRDFIKSDFLSLFYQTTIDSSQFDAAKTTCLSGNGNITALISYLNEGIQRVPYFYANETQSEAFWVVHTRFALWCMGAEFGSEIPNRHGRSDLLLFIGNTQYVLEFKVIDANGEKKRLMKVAREALEQVETKKYDENDVLTIKREAGVLKQTVKIGIVVDKHKTMRKIALMLSKMPDGKLTRTYFE